jgi:hypothetical protein
MLLFAGQESHDQARLGIGSKKLSPSCLVVLCSTAARGDRKSVEMRQCPAQRIVPDANMTNTTGMYDLFLRVDNIEPPVQRERYNTCLCMGFGAVGAVHQASGQLAGSDRYAPLHARPLCTAVTSDATQMQHT